MPETQPAETVSIRFRINGRPMARTVESRKLLSDFIREDLALTGTHVGCEYGVCGACTVVVDGQLVRSCLLFAAQVDGADVETIEGLASDPDAMHPVQQAFWDHHGLQCGFCTPGMVVTTKEFLARNPAPTVPNGVERIGEAGAIAPYAIIAAAVEDALRPLGRVVVGTVPLTPGRVRRLVEEATADGSTS